MPEFMNMNAAVWRGKLIAVNIDDKKIYSYYLKTLKKDESKQGGEVIIQIIAEIKEIENTKIGKK